MRLVIGDPANIDNIMVEMSNHRFPNLGVLSIFSYIRERMDGLDLNYLGCNLGLDEYIARLEVIKPDVYGISFASLISDTAFKTIDAVKEKFPDIPVICGGTHPTAAFADVLTRSKADICVIGEGEQTMLELVRYFESGEGTLSDIPGIAYMEGGLIKTTSRRRHMKDLGELPLPAWDLVDLDSYEGLSYCKAVPNTAMVFSRGCPFDCVYCSNPVWRSDKPWLRLRPPEQITEEITLLYNKGIREIWIRADEFNSRLEWTLEVCEAIRELGYRDLYFECNLRADKVTPELAKALKGINVWMVNIGIESFNQRVLDGIGKHVTVQQIKDSCRVLKGQGIDVYAWLMCYQIWEENGELCWETPREVSNTLKVAKALHGQGLIDLMSWQISTPIPGARMFDIAKRHGLISEPYQYNVWKVSTSIPGLSERQVQVHRLSGMLLQSYMAYKKGRVGWASRRNILSRAKYIVNAGYKVLRPGLAG